MKTKPLFIALLPSRLVFVAGCTTHTHTHAFNHSFIQIGFFQNFISLIKISRSRVFLRHNQCPLGHQIASKIKTYFGYRRLTQKSLYDRFQQLVTSDKLITRSSWVNLFIMQLSVAPATNPCGLQCGGTICSSLQLSNRGGNSQLYQNQLMKGR